MASCPAAVQARPLLRRFAQSPNAQHPLREESSKQRRQQGGPEVFKPTGKVEGALDELKNLGINKDDVPEWMKPSNDLLHKVNSDKEVGAIPKYSLPPA